jgi:hypothetical protein
MIYYSHVRIGTAGLFTVLMCAAASEVNAVSPDSGMCDPRAGDQAATNFIVGVPTCASNIHTIVCIGCFKIC